MPRNAKNSLLPALLVLAAVALGCDRDERSGGRLVAVWGRRGVSAGRFQKPRAMAVDRGDHLYIVDMTARIQILDTEGRFLGGWQTPAHDQGRPTGLSIGRDGNLLVADTHYHRVLVYSAGGELLKTWGTHGQRPGEFGLVTHVVQDSEGNYYVAEYGDCDRVQKFAADGRFILQWGSHGSEPGQFSRPQKLALDEHDHVWVADAGNHRIEIFDSGGKLLTMWGSEGSSPGQLYYPYDLALAPDESVYICEYGNHRIQKFTRDGRPLACWGKQGRGEGELFNPWALVRDSRGRIYVLDTNNHRVQCIEM